MKKILSVLLVIMCVFGLAACGGNKADATTFEDALLKDGVILVGTSPDYPPFETLDANGNLMGFDIDMMNTLINYINAQQGTNLTVEWKQMDFNNILGALEAKQIDIAVSGFTYSEERDCWFSETYLNSKQVIITRADTGITCADDLSGKKVGAGLTTTGAMCVEEIEGAELVQPGDYTVMFQALQAGQLDAVVCDEAVGDNYVAAMGLVKCEEALIEEDMKVIANKKNTLVHEAIDAAIKEFKTTDDYHNILVKWGMAE